MASQLSPATPAAHEAAQEKRDMVSRAMKFRLAAMRARDNGVQVYCVSGNPSRWMATSVSTPGACYEVTFGADGGPVCRCKAAEFGKICVHVAAVLDRLHLLPAVPADQLAQVAKPTPIKPPKAKAAPVALAVAAD